jgi:GDP-4-dehydro-6-deoxy-D-mannose reductase
VKRLLVTGADGFVGRWLVRSARNAGLPVVAVIGPGAVPPGEWQVPAAATPSVEIVAADLRDPQAGSQIAKTRPDAVVHLAAIASGAEARQDPAAAMALNSDATTRLAIALARTSSPRFLFISTAEVYGVEHSAPISEAAPVRPGSPYAASKAQAEAALAVVAEHDRLPIMVVRAFPHTGPGQTVAYVLPALAARLRAAKRAGAHVVKAGNLDAVRDFLDVRDVVRAYLLLLDHGQPGEVYNVASGIGRRLADCFEMLARVIDVAAVAEPDAALLRPGDIPVLVGDATKLRTATGWSPEIGFERTLQDLVHAQAD